MNIFDNMLEIHTDIHGVTYLRHPNEEQTKAQYKEKIHKKLMCQELEDEKVRLKLFHVRKKAI